jgi:hypothetical protein
MYAAHIVLVMLLLFAGMQQLTVQVIAAVIATLSPAATPRLEVEWVRVQKPAVEHSRMTAC